MPKGEEGTSLKRKFHIITIEAKIQILDRVQNQERGEGASADVDAADKYSEEFAKMIKEHDYLPDQIFNADETGLWWKQLPLRTFISKNEKRTPGFKVSNDRITLLSCSNSSGDFMTTPMFINRPLNPRSMKALLLEAAVQETVANLLEDENKNVVRLANVIRGDGFDEITVDDIRELVTDDEINEAHLVAMANAALSIEDSFDDLYNAKIENFSLKRVEKILNLSKKLEEYVLENDPLRDRAEIFKRNLKNNLSAYQEIYKDLLNKGKQTSIKYFFRTSNR
uniref:DDE-1 domain-containing protein n=1 Tax=Glossina austeni TaxID=7395 RepID=A0A1A9UM54_GLOAU